MSENEDSTMSEESDAEIFGKYEDKDYGIHDDSDTDYTDEDDEDQHYSRKKASMILGKFLLVEPIGTYKTLSMKVYNIQKRKIQTWTQKRQRRFVLIN